MNKEVGENACVISFGLAYFDLNLHPVPWPSCYGEGGGGGDCRAQILQILVKHYKSMQPSLHYIALSIPHSHIRCLSHVPLACCTHTHSLSPPPPPPTPRLITNENAHSQWNTHTHTYTHKHTKKQQRIAKVTILKIIFFDWQPVKRFKKWSS